jgi:hypothetical protein
VETSDEECAESSPSVCDAPENATPCEENTTPQSESIAADEVVSDLENTEDNASRKDASEDEE